MLLEWKQRPIRVNLKDITKVSVKSKGNTESTHRSRARAIGEDLRSQRIPSNTFQRKTQPIRKATCLETNHSELRQVYHSQTPSTIRLKESRFRRRRIVCIAILFPSTSHRQHKPTSDLLHICGVTTTLAKHNFLKCRKTLQLNVLDSRQRGIPDEESLHRRHVGEMERVQREKGLAWNLNIGD